MTACMHYPHIFFDFIVGITTNWTKPRAPQKINSEKKKKYWSKKEGNAFVNMPFVDKY